MISTPEAAPPRPSALDALAVYLRPRVLIVMFLGFSSGLPLALSGSTLLVWMREAGVDLGTIGLFALVGTPYTLKFIWAPVVDALNVPLLSRWLGRRRGWLLLTQILLIGAIIFLGSCDPVTMPGLVALGALMVAATSATQDIVIDAFRVESLPENEQAAGMASYVAAYRLGALASTAGALYLVTGFESLGYTKHDAWVWGYYTMGILVIIGMGATFLAREPKIAAAESPDSETGSPLQRVITSAVGAFSEFLGRDMAFIVLAFVILYKLCDAFAGTMTAPFVIDLGFTRDQYATIVKVVGLAATLLGGFAGGMLARAYPLATSLWVGAILQMVSNFVFTWQAYMGVDLRALTVTICVENFTGAIGTVVFVAYLSALCRSPLHTATQYALLTALAAIGRTYLSSVAGYLAAGVGWSNFFMLSALVALPGMALLLWLQRAGHFDTLTNRASFVADID